MARTPAALQNTLFACGVPFGKGRGAHEMESGTNTPNKFPAVNPNKRHSKEADESYIKTDIRERP